MILTQLKEYIVKHGRPSRSVLAKHFSISEDGVDAMLDVWLRRGMLSRELVGCRQETSCQTAKEVWYRWHTGPELSITVIR